MSYYHTQSVAYHEDTPNLPRKPNEYQRMQSGSSMNDLLRSLNIDDDYNPQAGQARQPESSALLERQQSHAIQYADWVPPIPVAQNYLPSTHASQGYLNGAHTGYQPGSPGSEKSWSQYNYEGNQNTSTPSQKVIEPAAAHGKPTRKPVDTSPKARTYFSPDDLDELVKDHPRYRGEVASQQMPYNPAPAILTENSVSGIPVPSHYDAQQGRSGYLRSARQPPAAGQDFLSHRSSLPMPDVATNPARHASPIGNYEPSNLYGDAFDHEDHFRRRSTSPYHPLQNNGSLVRLPSPPVRRETLPRPPSVFNSPQNSAAVLVNSDLAPPMHSRMSSPQMHTRPLPRQDSMPIRSMSTLSNYSQTSNDRDMLYRYPTAEPEVYNGGRVASPDRYHQQFRATAQEDDDRSMTASVPPAAQSRRGRQRGEVITESDLPAMPPLFVENPGSRDYSHPPMSTFPVSVSPSRSPTRNSMILPNRSPRKRHSFAREADKLQSIKCLPIKPIRCPPLCLEERFHPFAFVKTNKFKIKVYPYQEPFVAGGEIFGHIDIISDEGFRAQLGSTQVAVGEIGVEVIGYEEMQHIESGHNPRSFTFLYSRKIFQLPAETHPERALEEHILTSAVLNSPPPDKDGYRSASKGTTSFPFSFHLPVDAPSSADLHTARVKYLVTGYATVKLQGSHEIIATSVPIRVVEAWDVDNPIYEEPIDAAYGRDIANYHEIAATAKIARSLYLEGQNISGIIRIANHSSKKIREVKFQLMNKITFFGDKRPPVNDLNPSEDLSIETSVHGHSEPHVLVNGEEETWSFNLSIPEDRCVSVRNTALFEVTPFILIKISTGPLQKSTRLEMPAVSIANPESLVDHDKRLAPTSDVMKWSNLPFLYRHQVMNNGEPGPAQKGTLEILDLITYVSAQERVMLLSTG